MVNVREMTIDDYPAVVALLERTAGVRLREADSRAGIERYLQRNPGFSCVAERSGRIVGCIMSGHDGRRGYLQHLAVESEFRRQGIGKALASHCIDRLAEVGILKSHIDVLTGNEPAAAFWLKLGWVERADIVRFSYIASGGENV